MFEITIMLAFLLTVVAIVAYEIYWEYRTDKAKEKEAARLARKAVEMYGDHIPPEIIAYIKEVKNYANET